MTYLNVAVGLQGRQNDIDEPEDNESETTNPLRKSWAAELSTVNNAAASQNSKTYDSAGNENDDAVCEITLRDFVIAVVVNRTDDPRESEAEENID
jgi:hypothetical protein